MSEAPKILWGFENFDWVGEVTKLGLSVPVGNEHGCHSNVYVFTGDGIFGLGKDLYEHAEREILRKIQRYAGEVEDARQ